MKASLSKVDWKKGDGLIPAIIQDSKTGLVLMLGFMNKEALQKTLKTKKVWFYSRTRKRLWMKGETSKNILKLVDVKLDCDQDTLLIKAEPTGPTCHTGNWTCFDEEPEGQGILTELFALIESRKKKMPKDSYTTHLFSRGLKKICAKVEEESGEVIQAATQETKKRLIEESVDLLYHLFVLLVEKKIAFEEILEEVQLRRK